MITQKQAEEWLESKRVELGLNSLQLGARSYMETCYDAHKDGDCISSANMAQIEEWAKQTDPAEIAKRNLSDAKERLEKAQAEVDEMEEGATANILEKRKV